MLSPIECLNNIAQAIMLSPTNATKFGRPDNNIVGSADL